MGNKVGSGARIMEHFVSGMIVMSFIVAGVFFLRFWRDAHDRLFAFFAIAFFLFAVNRTALDYVGGASEATLFLYLIRLLAFCLIIAAIVDKNRSQRTVGNGRGAKTEQGRC
jgi:hypothetical protein